MKDKLKIILKKLIGDKKRFHIIYAKDINYKKYRNKRNNSLLKKVKDYKETRVYYNKNKGIELNELLKNIEIDKVSKENKFYYHIDYKKTTCSLNSLTNNISLDYSIILDNSLEDLKGKLKNDNTEFYNTEVCTIEAMEILIDRIVSVLKKNNSDRKIIDNILNIKNKKASTLYEALQRILFINMLLWQTNHKLNGLGRLDEILISYYKNDIKNKVMTNKEAKQFIKEFLLELHKFYKIKSNVLLGDTGQIIEIGGNDIDGNYLCNELTYIFIELMEELKLPDPKVLLRVSEKTPRDLIEKSLKCIQTGIGCPLFANDDVVIPKLIEYGYEKKEAYNYGTSACWEPYIIGKASDQNNFRAISFMNSFNDLLENEDLDEFKNINELIEKYKEYIKKYLEKIIIKINKMQYEKEPIISLFIDNCMKNSIDISEGGAKYKDTGLTTVGLANVVNSICNIDEIVFKNKEVTLSQFNNIRKEDFVNNEDLLEKLKNTDNKYGCDSEVALDIANNIIKATTKILKGKTNSLGGKIKFGLSAPTYIDSAKNFPSSFDGRKTGEPFAVHISSDKSEGYTELIQFAAKLDYGENRFNGNVVDFFVSPNFIKDNFDKFVDFLILSIKVGFFEMQMNVVSSKQLIEARKNPEKFPNLVVRVWGFSAYFKDLPDEYKDYLIERALKSESNN